MNKFDNDLPSPVPSVARVGATVARVAGIVARRAACFRAVITGTARREVGTTRSAGADAVNGVAAMKAVDMIALERRKQGTMWTGDWSKTLGEVGG